MTMVVYYCEVGVYVLFPNAVLLVCVVGFI